MRLGQWVKQQGVGELTRLRRETGVAYTTIHLLAHDHHPATYAVAVKLSDATGGAVSVAELCELPRKRLRRARRQHKRIDSAPLAAAQSEQDEAVGA